MCYTTCCSRLAFRVCFLRARRCGTGIECNHAPPCWRNAVPAQTPSSNKCKRIYSMYYIVFNCTERISAFALASLARARQHTHTHSFIFGPKTCTKNARHARACLERLGVTARNTGAPALRHVFQQIARAPSGRLLPHMYAITFYIV